MTDLSSLIERLEKLDGPDRACDDLIGAAAYSTDPIGAFSPGSNCLATPKERETT